MHLPDGGKHQRARSGPGGCHEIPHMQNHPGAPGRRPAPFRTDDRRDHRPGETEFGTYIPQPAQILPAAESCTVAPDLSNAVARERLRRGIEAGSAHSVPAL